MVVKIDVKNADEVREKKDELSKDLLELLESLIKRKGPPDEADRLQVDLLKTAYSHATDVERRLADAERQTRQDAQDENRQSRQDKQFVATVFAARVAAASTFGYLIIEAIRFCQGR